jgi:uncharacterized protein YdhG (YjbR/CyaY superfamily)
LNYQNAEKMKNEVDLYIEQFPLATQKQLNKLRAIIKAAAPSAQEMISYKMPAYKLNGMLVYFAGYKAHIGFYPTASGIQHFLPKIQDYKHSKGAVQFPIDKPLPKALIEEIVAFRIKENNSKK